MSKIGELTARINAKPTERMPLDALLEQLRGFGEVSLHGYPSGDTHQGWRCKVEISGAVIGVSGKVQSEWQHQTPETAAAECLERCRAAFGRR